MNKNIRFLLVLLLLAGVVVAAGSKSVWAGSELAAPAEAANPVSVAAGPNIGTVIVSPPSLRVIGTSDGVVSVSGIATLTGTGSNTDVAVSLSPKPDGYLSKIVNLNFSSGSARLCFAAVKGTETINFNVNGEWVPLFTFYVSGQACVIVDKSGQYVLGD